MLKFSTLLIRVEQVTEKSDKLELLRNYLSTSNPAEFSLAIQLLTHRLKLKTLTTEQLFELSMEFSGLPEWLINESINTAGDMVEGLTLILPIKPSEEENLTLEDVIESVQKIRQIDPQEKKKEIFVLWKKLHSDSRLIVNKLMTSKFRSSFSIREIAETLADLTTYSALWHTVQLSDPSQKLSRDNIFTQTKETEKYRLYTFRKNQSFYNSKMAELQNEPFYFQAIPDGDRAFLIKRNDFVFIWPEEEISLKKHIVLDFSSRKIDGVFEIYLTKPNHDTFLISDVYEWNGKDVSSNNRKDKIDILESVQTNEQFSEPISFLQWKRADKNFLSDFAKNSNGQMRIEHETESSKSWIIHPIRKRIKAVLLYAQKEEQNRYMLTVGLSDGNQWIPITKVNDGLSDDEWHELDQYIRKNTTEKFGPVRTVKPEMVFEISFERISSSARHKSGLILHSSHIEKWVKFANVKDLILLETLKNDLI